jgi:thymidylate synthase
MKAYLEILQRILDKGIQKKNRTGIDTISITGAMFEHDISEGFPLLTTKKMAYKSMLVELEGFIKGITSKKWYQERNCHFWDFWCNPQKVPYGNDEETKIKMKEEDDLGPIYGKQWISWQYYDGVSDKGFPVLSFINQLKNAIDTLKKDPYNRRIIVSAWNPADLRSMSLVPCHYGFQLLSDGSNLDLLWNQRSNDFPIGNPINIASYATLLCLIAKEVNMKPRKLVGFLADVHIYVNQLDGVHEQLKREPLPLPKVEFPGFTSIFDWDHTKFQLLDYKSHEKIHFPIAV